jgi:hypothetical protein
LIPNKKGINYNSHKLINANLYIFLHDYHNFKIIVLYHLRYHSHLLLPQLWLYFSNASRSSRTSGPTILLLLLPSPFLPTLPLPSSYNAFYILLRLAASGLTNSEADILLLLSELENNKLSNEPATSSPHPPF